MMQRYIVVYCWFIILLLASPIAPANAAVVDCNKVFATQETDRPKLNPKDVQQCIMRGVSPPKSWREKEGKSSGVTAPGSGSSSLGIVQGPERSPGAVGAPFSINKQALDFSLKFPPWAGFPCKLPGGINLCGGDGDHSDRTNGSAAAGAAATGAAGFCPAETDTTGTFGATSPLSGSQQATLVCGGAIPLTGYALSVTRNASFLATTEQGAFFLWLYQKSGNQFSAVGEPIRLPSFLCKPDNRGRLVTSVTLAPPVAQMITYTRNMTYLALQMNELDIQTNPDAENYEGPERYLVIPLQGGVPQVPADCALEAEYFKPITGIEADNTLTNSITPQCEGSFCSAAAATTPATGSCDTATTHPAGTVNTNQGPVACDGKIQITVLSRPNLIYPPGSTPTTSAIAGRTSVMANSIAGSSLALPAGTVVQFGKTAPDYILPDGGSVELIDGGKLVMRGPATISPANGSVTLTYGGEQITAQGSTVQNFAAGARVAPAVVQPITVNINRDIALPEGYAIPTQPNPSVRLPVNAK